MYQSDKRFCKISSVSTDIFKSLMTVSH